MEPAGKYRVVEYDGKFKIEKSVHVWDTSSFWYKKLESRWWDVNNDGWATHCHPERGWTSGKPCKTYNTLKDAKEKIRIMKCGEIMHDA